jgi:hypothetical protein
MHFIKTDSNLMHTNKIGIFLNVAKLYTSFY